MKSVALAMIISALSFSAADAGSTRPLYVFAPGDGDSRLVQQRRALDLVSRGLAERDMPVIVVSGDRVEGSRTAAAALRARFSVSRNQFRVILVGKDGGVKLNSARLTPSSDLFALVDAMPMRQDEMRRRR